MPHLGAEGGTVEKSGRALEYPGSLRILGFLLHLKVTPNARLTCAQGMYLNSRTSLLLMRLL